MGIPMIVSKSIILWTLMGFIKCQDPQNYFFTPSNQGQNRFVPSYQNPRTQNFLGGSRNSLTSAASTYPEQLIFLNNNDGDQSTSQLSPGYSPFAQHLPLQQTTRNPDYYDISPRPFGSAAGSQGFTRPKTLRTSGSSGFIPLSGHQTRTNVPHQQSHFLSHFNEQQSAPINAPVAATSNFPSNRINGGGRPFGSGTGNTSGFSRNRPFGGTQYNRQLQQQQQNKQTTTFDDDLVTPPQQQLPFRNTRTRFQPSSAKTSTTTTTTTSSTTSKPSRYNRFGSGARSPSTQSGSSEFRQTVGSALQTLPSRGRLPVTSVNKTLFQPRRPVIISRESNRPYGIGSSAGRITVNHNGSDKGSPNSTNSLEEDDLDESSQDESVPEEIHEQNHVSQGPKEELFEKLSLHEAGASVAPSSSSSAEQQSPDEKHQHDQPVILTSNFYLPGSDDDEEGGGEEELANHSGEVEEEVENSKEGSASKEHDLPETTHHHQGEYDYEYEDGNVTSTQSAETEFTEPATEMEQNTEAKVDQVKVEVPKTELSTESEATPAVEVTTMQSPESTAFYDEDEYEDGLGSGVDGSGVDGSGVESTKEDGSGADGSGTDGSGEVSEEITAKQPNKEFVGREVVSVVTTKSVINGSTAFPQPVTSSTTTMMEEDLYTENKLTPAKETPEDLDESEGDHAESAEEQNVQNTTESYVVIASIQTSRSINGARFLPFPAIEQEETKQTLSELERKIHGKNSRKKTPLSANDSNENGSSGEMDDSPSTNTTVSSIAERPANEEPDEEEEEEKSVSVETTTPTTTSTTASRFVPNIRKFIPKSASKPKINTEDLPMDDLTGLLPPGFKPRPSFKNKKLNKPTTTTTPEPSSIEETRKPQRNSTIGRSFKNSPNAAQDVALAGLLPKGYRTTHAPVGPTEPPTKKLDDLLSKIKFEDNLDKLVPADYKLKATTPKPPVTFVDDISKFLPPGFKLPSTTTTTSTTSKPAIKFADDISKFLPPGFKAPADEKPELKVAVADDISKFLPPGFKLDKAPKEEAIDISKLLPKDYKPLAKEVPVVKKTETTVASEVNSTEKTSTTKAVPTTTAAPTGGLKVVFPKGFNNRRPGQRLTTPHSNSAEAAGPTQPSIVIKKGPPQRATTEFTGWPTPSTTPISIEKLLEQARTATVDISDLLPQTSTSSTTSTTSTTTTTTEPPRPTKPGHCKSDCDLAGTIKIIDGVSWKPELLDHNTAEWKNLAREVEAQLNEVYSNAPHLNQWYKKVRIDSFSKGSVLVDYFVELGNITQDVDTLEIKKLFHQALTQPPLPVVPLQPDVENKTDSHQESASHEGKGEKLVKETYLMGRFVVDPSSTDFIVIPKSFAPTVEFAEDEALIPHWAIVLIVIGIGSLCFVVIFGVTVLINRQKNSKKTPMPLTADMMNDLKVNHMGGADNYGVDDFYNIDDAWNDTKQPIKPKRFTNSMHGSSASNIYDSWRSTRHGDYYYDSHNYTPHNKADQYPSDAFADVHQMYTYNNPRSRYQRDYDPDF